MKLTDKIIGTIGGVLILFCLVYYSIMNVWDIYNWISIVLGVAGTGYFLYVFYSKRERGFSSRNLQYGSNVGLQIIIVIGIVALLAFITTRRHYRADWTKNKLYSLAEQTDNILSNLEKEVQIYAFYKESDRAMAKDVLDEYAYRSDYLNYEFIDPDEKPQITKRLKVTQYNQIVVESGIKREIIDQLSEANLTNAIVKVTRVADKVIYFLTGHGEKSISSEDRNGFSSAVEAIKNDNHIVRELNLVRRMGQGKGIPDSCSVLAIVGPTANFFPGELDSIGAYIDNGGKALIMLDPQRPQDIAEWLKKYRVEVGNNIVLDASGMGQLFGAGPAIPLVTNYSQDNAITEGFSIMTFYPQTVSVIPMEDKGDYTIKEILKTSPNSWAETNLQNAQAAFDQGEDIQGPVTIANLIEKDDAGKKMALVVFGDSDFASNSHFQNQGNSNIFLNTINFLAEEEDMISIRPKEIDDRRLTLTQADVKIVFYLSVIAIPLLVIIIGVVFYIRRGK